MRVFVAGASGVIGVRLVPLLVAAGHAVAGMTRSPGKVETLRDLGAEPVVCDAFDAGALRAVEIGADAIMKATKVDGIYSADPVRDASAERLPTITYREVINRRLEVMDTAAIALCEENKLPIVVFDLTRPGNIRRIIRGEPVGSIVTSSV